jgi:hypothetical protein
MPEKWAGFGLRMMRPDARLRGLPRFYVAPFIGSGAVRGLWMAVAAVQRLAR